MHIPDGFLAPKTAVTTAALSLAALGAALHRLRSRIAPRQVPLMGLGAAFVFTAQLINFPVAGGTSGHLVGAVLTAVLLGPDAAIVVLTAVLVVQCFIFADGGVLALGANVFNMAVVGSTVGYAIYRATRKLVPGQQGMLAGVAFASWTSVVLMSIVCAGELAWSGTVAWSAAFVAMTNIHMLIGIGEAIITTLVIVAIARTRPDLLEENLVASTRSSKKSIVVYGIVCTLGLLLFVVPFASKWPDGLERIAATLGFEHRALPTPLVSSPIVNYAVPGIGSPAAATVVAGLIGTVIVFVLSFILARFLTAKSR
jgi:cobalt/nickel transport system permease protein